MYKRSVADPCLYYRWNNGNLVLWLSWVDDLFVCGNKANVLPEVAKMKTKFKCDDGGPINEYIGCKVDYKPDEHMMKLTQPVLLQSFTDEFEIDSVQAYKQPAAPNTVLKMEEEEPQVSDEEKSLYRKGVGKLLYMMKWSCPEILNAVRELTQFSTVATKKHMGALYRCMKYCVATKDRGRTIKPNVVWNGDKDFEFTISGESDSDYAKDPLTRRSVTGYAVFLQGVSISEKSKMQGGATLSVTEAEAASAVECAQDMLFAMRVMESMELKVKKPMLLWMDNKGAVDLFNGWGVSGRTRHIGTKLNFLRELKEEGTLEV